MSIFSSFFKARDKPQRSIHLDDKVFYDAFVEVFNSLVENKNHYMAKWQELLHSEYLLKKVTAKRFIAVFENIYFHAKECR